MKRLLLCLLLTALLASSALAAGVGYILPPAGFDAAVDGVLYGETLLCTYASATTGSSRNVVILLPPSYTAEKQYPVLYLLHGGGGDEHEWAQGRPAWVIGNLIHAGEAAEMIVVMPNVRARANDGVREADMHGPEERKAFDHFINDLRDDLMPYVAANFSIATGRENTAIAGLSLGGREALYIGLTMPEAFGYIGAFCPAPGVLPYDEEEGLIPVECFRAPEGMETYILINTGRTDGVVGQWPKTYAKTLTANGTANTFYITDGGHDFTVWKHGLFNFVRNIFK